MSGDGNAVLGVFLLAASILAYFLPSMIASRRRHPSAGAIFLLNLLTGWTGIGWLAALIWSASSFAPAVVITQSQPPKAIKDQLGEIEDLKSSGAITQDEYDAMRRKILS